MPHQITNVTRSSYLDCACTSALARNSVKQIHFRKNAASHSITRFSNYLLPRHCDRVLHQLSKRKLAPSKMETTNKNRAKKRSTQCDRMSKILGDQTVPRKLAHNIQFETRLVFRADALPQNTQHLISEASILMTWTLRICAKFKPNILRIGAMPPISCLRAHSRRRYCAPCANEYVAICQKSNADWNSIRGISVVGTRHSCIHQITE